MSQDASARQTLLNSDQPRSSSASEPNGSDAASGVRGFSVESYADRLMDELFGDVEQALEMRTAVPQPLAQPEPISFPEPAPTPPEVARALPLAIPLVREAMQEAAADLLANVPDAAMAPAEMPEKPTRARRSGRSYDRLLLGVGCTSIIVTLALWLVSQELHRKPPAPAQTASSQTAPAADSQFAAYVQQAMQRLDQRTPSPAPTTIAQSPSVLPTVTVPSMPKPPMAAARTPTALERVYVPVYQMPPSLFPGGAAVAPVPRSAAPVAVKPPVPLSVPGVARTLRGLADMGDDRSAALIEINGIVQRYRVGESIGTSGWTLVEVSKNQAIIRRNGEVRSVFIGQNF